MLRVLILAAGLVAYAAPAYAACTNEQTFGADGRIHYCSVCCYPGGACVRQCF